MLEAIGAEKVHEEQVGGMPVQHVSRDVAPTVAHLLRTKLGDVEGRLLADALA